MSSNGIKAGNAYIEITARDAQLRKSLAEDRKQVEAFLDKAALIGGAAVLATAAAAVHAYKTIGDELNKMAARTGLTAQALSELDFAAQRSGAGLKDVETGVKTMNRFLLDAERSLEQAAAKGLTLEESLQSLSSTPQIKTLRDLQIDVDAFFASSPEERFLTLAGAIGDVADPGKQSALAMQVFGRAGTALLPMIQEGSAGLQALRDRANDLGGTMSDEAAKGAADLTDAFFDVETATRGVLLQLGAELAPTLTMLANLTADLIAENRDLIVLSLRVGLAMVGVAAALKGVNIAMGIYAKRAAIAQALSGPRGWIVLAAGVAAATLALQAINSQLGDVANTADAAAKAAGQMDGLSITTRVSASGLDGLQQQLQALPTKIRDIEIQTHLIGRPEVNLDEVQTQIVDGEVKIVGVTGVTIPDIDLTATANMAAVNTEVAAANDLLLSLDGYTVQIDGNADPAIAAANRLAAAQKLQQAASQAAAAGNDKLAATYRTLATQARSAATVSIATGGIETQVVEGELRIVGVAPVSLPTITLTAQADFSAVRNEAATEVAAANDLLLSLDGYTVQIDGNADPAIAAANRLAAAQKLQQAASQAAAAGNDKLAATYRTLATQARSAATVSIATGGIETQVVEGELRIVGVAPVSLPTITLTAQADFSAVQTEVYSTNDLLLSLDGHTVQIDGNADPAIAAANRLAVANQLLQAADVAVTASNRELAHSYRQLATQAAAAAAVSAQVATVNDQLAKRQALRERQQAGLAASTAEVTSLMAAEATKADKLSEALSKLGDYESRLRTEQANGRGRDAEFSAADIDSVRDNLINSMTGYGAEISRVRDEIAKLDGTATDTSLKLRELAENGVPSDKIDQLRAAFAQLDELRQGREDAENLAEQRRDADDQEQQRQKGFEERANELRDLLKTPAEKFADLVAEVKSVVANTDLSVADASAFLTAEQDKLTNAVTSSLTAQERAANSFRKSNSQDLRSAAGNSLLASIANQTGNIEKRQLQQLQGLNRNTQRQVELLENRRKAKV